MFWRLLEYLFLLTTAIIGGRFVYLLWTGKDRHDAAAHLADAREDAEAASLERQAEAIRQRTQTKGKSHVADG